MFWLWMFLIYWLLLFVASYIVTEYGQKYFYDEVTPFAGLKVGGVSLALAGFLTWWDPSSVNMVTTDIAYTAMLAIAGFVLFCLVIQFHASHALLLGPVTVVLVAFTAAMAMDSLKAGPRANLRDRPIPPQERTIRKSASSTVGIPVPKEGDEDAATEKAGSPEGR
ncbi:hypothetical protein [Tautonia marina]|uniref:hypothetical protein n=1 Tax=Tautonia marina TaxID=2653855 RepID=UPI001375E7E4|nr:hypothetical protein [Tautonia marina]